LAPIGDPAHPVLFGAATASKTGPDANGNYAWTASITAPLDARSVTPGDYIAFVYGDDGSALTSNAVANGDGYTTGDTTYFIYPTLTAPLTVTQADATITVTGYTGAYDGAAHGATGTATGVNGENLNSLLHLGSSFTNAPGGTAHWTFDGNAKYKAASGDVAITITQADATIAVNGYTGVYDGNPHGATGTATGVKGESLSSLLHLGSSFTDVPGGTASWTFDGNTNYKSAIGNAAITITQAEATVSVLGYTGVYDGNPHGATGTATGVKGESLSSLLHLGSSFTDVPGGTASWTFDGNTNYKSANGSVAITLNQAAATISVDGYTGVYDGNPHGASGTAKGVKGESLSSLLHSGATFTDVPGGTANWMFDGNTNYKSATGNAAITITKADATVSVAGYSGTYDGTAHGASGTAKGVKNESLSALLNLGSIFTNVPGGVAHWTFAGSNNYKASAGDVPITITTKALTITANDASKLIGASNPVMTVTYSGFVSGEGPQVLLGTLAFTTSATAASPVGTYSVMPGGLTSSNYAISFVPGTLTITYNVCLLYDPTKAVHAGATIPLKFQLCSASGANQSASSRVVTAQELIFVSTNTSGPVVDAGNANPDQQFRFDSSLGPGYIFNLKTSGLATGTYRLKFAVTNDPQTHMIQFELR
jgi:hypothetical protein